MLAAVGADRHKLITLQAVNTTVVSDDRRRAQPGLATVRALGTALDRVVDHGDPKVNQA
jgi:hypothetical protein